MVLNVFRTASLTPIAMMMNTVTILMEGQDSALKDAEMVQTAILVELVKITCVKNQIAAQMRTVR